jgi:hypothetical protein
LTSTATTCFDKDGKVCGKDVAVSAIVQEFDEKGKMIREYWGRVAK